MSNVIANPGVGGATFATDTIAGVDFPKNKISFGADGAFTDVTTSAGLPIQAQAGSTWSVSQSGTWNVTNISGTITLPTGASTSALQTTGNTSLSNIDGKVPALGQALAAASVPVVLTAVQLTTLTPLSTVTANQGGAPWTQNVTQFGSNAVVTGTGVSGVGIPRVTVASDSSINAVQSGTWSTGRTWTTSYTTDSVANYAYATNSQSNNTEASTAAVSQDLKGNLRVIDQQGIQTNDILALILVELRMLNHMFQATQNSTDDTDRLRNELSFTVQ